MGGRLRLESVATLVWNTQTTLMDGLVRADPKLLDSYETALYNYSRFNPLLAHRVRGMKLLPKLSENLTNIAAAMTEALPDSEEAALVSAIGQKELESSKEKSVQELIVDLEKIIRRVSWSAGVWFWVCSWFLGAKRRKIANQDKGEVFDLHAFMESFFRSIALATNPSDELKEQIKHAKLDDILDQWESSCRRGQRIKNRSQHGRTACSPSFATTKNSRTQHVDNILLCT